MAFLIVYLFCWTGASVFWVYQALAWASPNRRALSRFYITDFWAAIVGLLPSFFALRYVLLSPDVNRSEGVFAVAILAASQCLGMFVMKATETPRSGRAPVNRWNSALTFLFGSIVGMAWIAFVMVLMWLLAIVLVGLVAVVFASVQYPLLGMILCFAFIAVALRRKKSAD